MLAIGFGLALSAQVQAADDTAANLNRQIEELKNQRKYGEAIPLAEQLVALSRQAHGDQNAETVEHPDTARSLNNLAELYEDMSRYAEAEPLYQEALKIRQKVLGPEHPDTATSLNNLALLYVRMGDYGKASQEAGISEAVVADYGSLPEGR